MIHNILTHSRSVTADSVHVSRTCYVSLHDISIRQAHLVVPGLLGRVFGDCTKEPNMASPASKRKATGKKGFLGTVRN